MQVFKELVTDRDHSVDDDPRDSWIGVRALGSHMKRRIRELSQGRQDPVVPPPGLGTERFLGFVTSG
jgi:hypothetical protein